MQRNSNGGGILYINATGRVREYSQYLFTYSYAAFAAIDAPMPRVQSRYGRRHPSPLTSPSITVFAASDSFRSA
jgi:hypothetical protein